MEVGGAGGRGAVVIPEGPGESQVTREGRQEMYM